MLATSADTELFDLRKLAESQAGTRRERVTSAHLLAAIALRAGPASELLHERGLTGERLLRAARSSTDELDNPVGGALQSARDVAGRMGAREPNATHLLVALLNERRGAAHKALEQCGIEVARLRIAAMNVGLGLVGRRRIVTRKSELEIRTAAVGQRGRGVAIPLFPPARRPEPVAAAPEALAESPTAAPGSRQGAVQVDPPGSSQSLALAADGGGIVSQPPAPAQADRAEARTTGAEITQRALQEVVPPGNKRGRPKDKSARPNRKAQAASYALDPKRQPALSSLGRNLTEAARLGELDRVVGRDEEVQQLLDILAKRQGNNPCLVGAPGVGKTSVVRALAQHVVDTGAAGVDERVIVEIPVGELIAGTGVRGALAQRLGQLKKEVLAAEGRVVVFFDEVHQLFVGDAAEEISGELKLSLARGELPCIGATTHEEYRRSIGADAALARRFSLVEVEEPSREDAYLVLEALSHGLEQHHGVTYSEEALALSIAWSIRYLPAQMLPDKAVSIVDLAGARVRRRGGGEVTPDAVAEVVSDLADVPLERLLETDRERMLGLESLLAERVVGHQSQISRIARILRRNGAGLNGQRPIGTFLLLGPTGVGKTETAKAVAEVLFYSEKAMTRLDMSEYSEPHSVARLVGAPPGYVGFEAGGFLTESVRRRPYQVVLLDEIEKAHPEVLETFLQVFDEGRLTDSKGRTVDFSNTVILVTSNIGAQAASAAPKRRLGFGSDARVADGDVAVQQEQAVIAAARAALAPELYNRLDEVLAFSPLSRDDVREITRRLLMTLGSRLLNDRGLELEIEEDALEALLDLGGFDATLGARPMKRCIARLVEAPLAERILDGSLSAGDRVLLACELGADGSPNGIKLVTPARS